MPDERVSANRLAMVAGELYEPIRGRVGEIAAARLDELPLHHVFGRDAGEFVSDKSRVLGIGGEDTGIHRCADEFVEWSGKRSQRRWSVGLRECFRCGHADNDEYEIARQQRGSTQAEPCKRLQTASVAAPVGPVNPRFTRGCDRTL